MLVSLLASTLDGKHAVCDDQSNAVAEFGRTKMMDGERPSHVHAAIFALLLKR